MNLSVKLSKLDFCGEVVEVDTMGEQCIGNPKDLNDLGMVRWKIWAFYEKLGWFLHPGMYVVK